MCFNARKKPITAKGIEKTVWLIFTSEKKLGILLNMGAWILF